METEDSEAWDVPIRIPDEDSGSDYGASDVEELDSSQEEEREGPRSSRANPSARRRRRSKQRGEGEPQGVARGPSESGGNSRDSSTSSQLEEMQRAASEWAASFQEPESAADIRSPTRHAAGTQSKRKADKVPSQVRAKRLKSWYNNDYRELLNVDIHDAAARCIAEDYIPVDGSQIGSSIWTSKEKDLFFSALSRLGRDSVRDIASRIETKSELEVQEYIQLLHQKLTDGSQKLLDLTDLPAAIEISNECCGVLERAGDALASRHDLAEEDQEGRKWGDLPLLNLEASKRIDRLRKDQAGWNDLERTLPAATLFHLRNWLELSHRIFMNPDREDDNWETIAEGSETPAIRATAFEDFHSLVVNITKRLVSTVYFCTMSRKRAMDSKFIKHADVNKDDVEAAVKVLGLKLNSRDFWTRCAKRCNLRVFDEDWNSFMSHEEVERALQEMSEHSRSRSGRGREQYVSRTAQFEAGPGPEEITRSALHSEDFGSDEDSLLGHESEYSSGESSSDEELTDHPTEVSKSRKERLFQRARNRKAAECANEEYIETFDNEASRDEEQRLWRLLRQAAPLDIKPEPIDLSGQPNGVFRNDAADQASWRDHLDYRSQWETMDTPVPMEKFGSRKMVPKNAEGRMEDGSHCQLGSSKNEVAPLSAESGKERNGSFDFAQDSLDAQDVLTDESLVHSET